MKIAVAGAGYVGLSIGVLMALRHEVSLLDVNAERVDAINRRQSLRRLIFLKVIPKQFSEPDYVCISYQCCRILYGQSS
jgi:UDP-N-acetyl-D-mannosaminuronate dehydrogenase